MLTQPYHLYVERVDPDRNMARFYTLAIEPTLFGTPRLVRRWGRIGTLGRTMVHDFEREEDAVALFLELLCERRSRGYRVKRAVGLGRGQCSTRREMRA
nr:WGR domain-containing protein [Shinella zoogloeoides]